MCHSIQALGCVCVHAFTHPPLLGWWGWNHMKLEIKFILFFAASLLLLTYAPSACLLTSLAFINPIVPSQVTCSLRLHRRLSIKKVELLDFLSGCWVSYHGCVWGSGLQHHVHFNIKTEAQTFKFRHLMQDSWR